MDAMEFFQRSAGEWRSQRTTHHLPFRRAENGGSAIQVETLAADHPQVVELCQMHSVDPGLTVGGAQVAWNGSMAWDKEDETHEGTTVFAIVPDADDASKGRLLRERGYAEIVPVVGRYEIDDEDAMILVTDYESMSIIERFWFASPDLRLRFSTVKRFGGFNTATFCAEVRASVETSNASQPDEPATMAHSISGW
ncbi:MAG: phycobiliprotein lyase [Cyanophyceae cyanobacterium]